MPGPAVPGPGLPGLEGAVPPARRAHLDARGGYGALIVQFAIKDFKIRYTHSVLGYAW